MLGRSKIRYLDAWVAQKPVGLPQPSEVTIERPQELPDIEEAHGERILWWPKDQMNALHVRCDALDMWVGMLRHWCECDVHGVEVGVPEIYPILEVWRVGRGAAEEHDTSVIEAPQGGALGEAPAQRLLEPVSLPTERRHAKAAQAEAGDETQPH